jgi:hypothetical protein
MAVSLCSGEFALQDIRRGAATADAGGNCREGGHDQPGSEDDEEERPQLHARTTSTPEPEASQPNAAPGRQQPGPGGVDGGRATPLLTASAYGRPSGRLAFHDCLQSALWAHSSPGQGGSLGAVPFSATVWFDGTQTEPRQSEGISFR